MKVSAILSAYYCEKYLPKRLENLLSQSVAPEIVAVFQRETKEAEILWQHAQDHRGQIVLCPQADVPTVYEAWNIAIGAATGEYLTSANSDDLFYEGAIEKLASALDHNPRHAMAYANVDRIKDWENPKTLGRFEWAEGGIRELYWQGCFLGPMPMWRKTLHETYGPFDGEMRSAGDYEFWLRLASNDCKFFHVKEVLGAHLEREDSLEHRSGLRSTWEQARARAKYREVAGDAPSTALRSAQGDDRKVVA